MGLIKTKSNLKLVENKKVLKNIHTLKNRHSNSNIQIMVYETHLKNNKTELQGVTQILLSKSKKKKNKRARKGENMKARDNL